MQLSDGELQFSVLFDCCSAGGLCSLPCESEVISRCEFDFKGSMRKTSGKLLSGDRRCPLACERTGISKGEFDCKGPSGSKSEGLSSDAVGAGIWLFTAVDCCLAGALCPLDGEFALGLGRGADRERRLGRMFGELLSNATGAGLWLFLAVDCCLGPGLGALACESAVSLERGFDGERRLN